MTDQNSDNEVNALNLFGADQMIARRQQAKALLQQKVAGIHQQRDTKAADLKQRAQLVQQLMEEDPRYIEMVALLNHPDMQAVSESLVDFITTFVEGPKNAEQYLGEILELDFNPPSNAAYYLPSYYLPRYRLGKGYKIDTTIEPPLLFGIREESIDSDIVNAALAGGATLSVVLEPKEYFSDNRAWFVQIHISWDKSTNGMCMTYFDSSNHESQQSLSRLDELFEKVALTLSTSPRLWRAKEREWEAFRSGHYNAIKAFEVMSRGSTLSTKLGSYFDVFKLWELGIEDEVKLVIQQIHNQFHQTELLQQIANNTSRGARFSAASYGVSSSNAAALSGISEQISQLSIRVEQLANR